MANSGASVQHHEPIVSHLRYFWVVVRGEGSTHHVQFNFFLYFSMQSQCPEYHDLGMLRRIQYQLVEALHNSGTFYCREAA